MQKIFGVNNYDVYNDSDMNFLIPIGSKGEDIPIPVIKNDFQRELEE